MLAISGTFWHHLGCHWRDKWAVIKLFCYNNVRWFALKWFSNGAFPLLHSKSPFLHGRYWIVGEKGRFPVLMLAIGSIGSSLPMPCSKMIQFPPFLLPMRS